MVSKNVLKKYLKMSNMKSFGDDVTSQAILSTTLLISMWQETNQVFDNTIFNKKCDTRLELHTVANWLYKYIPETRNILDKVFWCETDRDYDNLLEHLHSTIFDETLLKKYSGKAPQSNPMFEKDGKFAVID